MQDRTYCATSSTLGSGRGGNEPSKSPLTMYPLSQEGCLTREAQAVLLAPKQIGARVGWYGEHMRILVSVVSVKEPKVLTGLNQKECGKVQGLLISLSWTVSPPAYRGHPNPSKIAQDEHGKPVVLPFTGRQPQGAPMGLWVKEEGKSECRAVVARIGVAVIANITPRESGQTSLWSQITRELE